MKRWLQDARAAELLCVDKRTIKRWKKDAVKREALGAVRHGKQWRIPLPNSFDGDNEGAWEMQTRYRFKEMGFPLKDHWEKELEALSDQFARNEFETYRLWLAAYLALIAKVEAVTQEHISEILLLWQIACEILAPLPRGADVIEFKSQFPERLKMRGFTDERIDSIMSYWPSPRFFKQVHDAHSMKQLEKIRQRMDTAQAAKTCKHLGDEPTAGNLRAYHHKNFVEHINDTREALPKGFAAINNPTPEQIEWITLGSVYDQMLGKPPPPIMFDFRKPQHGLPLRTFRHRHPLRKSPQKEIIQAIENAQENIPGADERLSTGKAPIRGSKLSESSY